MAIDFKGIGSGQNTSVTNEGSRDLGKKDAAQSSDADTRPTAGSDDSVQLSPEVLALQKVESQLQGVPEVDAERVEAIRSAIEDGSYEINYERLASRLSSLERLLGS